MLSKKYLIGAIALLVIVVALFSGLRMSKASFDGVIRIGVFAPMDPNLPHWESGFLPAAELAAKQINDSGGILMGGKRYAIVLGYAHEPYDVETNPNWQTITVQSIHYLADPDKFNADIIVGGFRTECTDLAIRELITLNQTGTKTVPFFICGAATNELCYYAHSTNPEYPRYDYVYRVMPTNGTSLIYTVSGTIKGYLLADNGILTKLYGKGSGRVVDIAIVMENLKWTETMWKLLVENVTTRYGLLGSHQNLVYYYRLSPAPASGEIDTVLNNINASGAKLLIHIFSAPVGMEFIKAWGQKQVHALPVGINVMSQAKYMWYNWTNKDPDAKEAYCEYESHLMAMGTKTPITSRLVKFWDDFATFTGGKWPLYTGYGIYDFLMSLNETLPVLNTLDPEVYHRYVCPLYNASYYRDAPNGRFMFTPIHDIFSKDFGPLWPAPNYVRSMTVQWLDGRLEAVIPTDQTWSKIYCLPPWMYPLIWDITYDGYVGVDDVVGAAENFGAEPGTPRWDHRSDVTFDNYVGVDDIVGIAEHFGSEWTPPP
jgi:hypothetical protein